MSGERTCGEDHGNLAPPQVRASRHELADAIIRAFPLGFFLELIFPHKTRENAQPVNSSQFLPQTFTRVMKT
jgi:hypothetical protein